MHAEISCNPARHQNVTDMSQMQYNAWYCNKLALARLEPLQRCTQNGWTDRDAVWGAN